MEGKDGEGMRKGDFDSKDIDWHVRCWEDLMRRSASGTS